MVGATAQVDYLLLHIRPLDWAERPSCSAEFVVVLLHSPAAGIQLHVGVADIRMETGNCFGCTKKAAGVVAVAVAVAGAVAAQTTDFAAAVAPLVPCCWHSASDIDLAEKLAHFANHQHHQHHQHIQQMDLKTDASAVTLSAGFDHSVPPPVLRQWGLQLQGRGCLQMDLHLRRKDQSY